MKGFQRFLGPQVKAEHVYTDGSKEFKAALDDLGMSHDTSTPYRPQTNGVAERAVRRVKEGTSCTLSQSGWSDRWWVEAMNCYCFLRNAVDKLACGQTAYKKRFEKDFAGPIIPFGAEITYKPSRKRDIQRLHKFGEKVLSGIFIGYVQDAGGGWSGDLEVADWEEIQDAGMPSEIHTKRFKAKEITVIKVAGKFRFPLAGGDLKQPGDDLPRKSRLRGKPISHNM